MIYNTAPPQDRSAYGYGTIFYNAKFLTNKMMKSLQSKMVLLAICMLMQTFHVRAQGYTESFNDINTLAGNGWFMQNNSNPIGITGWFQGNDQVFPSYNGATNAYIGANFNNTTGGSGTISNWLLGPNRTLRNGDVFTFYTREVTGNNFPNRLEVRLSTNGASTNVGSSAAAVGDFTTLLLSVNPTLVASVYPQVWTLYTITISGLPAPTSGRIAFRYFVTSAGPIGSNSDYIGIDQIDYTPYVCPAFTMTAGGALTGGAAGTAYSTSLTQTGALGAPNYAITAGALPPGLTLSAGGTISGTPTATGTFNFTATVSDASGCTGSQSYSITVVCAANPISFPSPAALCSNDSPVDLNGFATPAGGTFSGTGVSAGQFDPAAGTQTVTYDYTDPYGCAFNSNNTFTVNTPPTVTQSAVAALCENASPITLTGGSPAGGTYSGTGVSAGEFDPASGTQTLTYEYTDANGCSEEATVTVTVNTPPTVTQDAIDALCENASPITLTGGSPAGGTYSGTGVSAGEFDPASGTQTLTYEYTDANGCSDETTVTVTVNTPPTVTQDAIDALCENASPITLTGGSPAGGTYSGIGVSAGEFDPASGTQTLTYEYTDANGCSEEATVTVTVNTPPAVTQDVIDALCENASPITLTGGSPAGGIYSGTGVSAGEFDPASGTQTLTYGYTDANGCFDETTFTVTVNTLPTVTQDVIDDLCSNASPITLTGGAPAGGTYSGTGVSAGEFDPASGTQILTYEYTDANGCSDETTFTVTVNTPPTVTQGNPIAVCADSSPITLTGGSPAGGTYSGTGVTGAQFDPTVGSQTLTYEYTDANGCSDEAIFAVTVHPLPTVSFTIQPTVCVYGAPITLIATPTGGNFTGNGVSGAVFTPSTAGVGPTTITYTYTDGLTCENDAQATIEVSACMGTEGNELANAVNVFPNPTTGQLNVSFNGFGYETTFEIMNVQGKRVYGEQISAPDAFTKTIDISGFANGVYYLRINGKAGSTVKTIVKQ
jgi:hypothetical protein